jgi:hypothetical protein
MDPLERWNKGRFRSILQNPTSSCSQLGYTRSILHSIDALAPVLNTVGLFLWHFPREITGNYPAAGIGREPGLSSE